MSDTETVNALATAIGRGEVAMTAALHAAINALWVQSNIAQGPPPGTSRLHMISLELQDTVIKHLLECDYTKEYLSTSGIVAFSMACKQWTRPMQRLCRVACITPPQSPVRMFCQQVTLRHEVQQWCYYSESQTHETPLLSISLSNLCQMIPELVRIHRCEGQNDDRLTYNINTIHTISGLASNLVTAALLSKSATETLNRYDIDAVCLLLIEVPTVATRDIVSIVLLTLGSTLGMCEMHLNEYSSRILMEGLEMVARVNAPLIKSCALKDCCHFMYDYFHSGQDTSMTAMLRVGIMAACRVMRNCVDSGSWLTGNAELYFVSELMKLLVGRPDMFRGLVIHELDQDQDQVYNTLSDEFWLCFAKLCVHGDSLAMIKIGAIDLLMSSLQYDADQLIYPVEAYVYHPVGSLLTATLAVVQDEQALRQLHSQGLIPLICSLLDLKPPLEKICKLVWIIQRISKQTSGIAVLKSCPGLVATIKRIREVIPAEDVLVATEIISQAEHMLNDIFRILGEELWC